MGGVVAAALHTSPPEGCANKSPEKHRSEELIDRYFEGEKTEFKYSRAALQLSCHNRAKVVAANGASLAAARASVRTNRPKAGKRQQASQQVVGGVEPAKVVFDLRA